MMRLPTCDPIIDPKGNTSQRCNPKLLISYYHSPNRWILRVILGNHSCNFRWAHPTGQTCVPTMGPFGTIWLFEALHHTHLDYLYRPTIWIISWFLPPSSRESLHAAWNKWNSLLLTIQQFCDKSFMPRIGEFRGHRWMSSVSRFHFYWVFLFEKVQII